MIMWKNHSRFALRKNEYGSAVSEHGIHSVFKTNPIRIGNRVVFIRLIPGFSQAFEILKAGMIWIPFQRKQGFQVGNASCYHLLEKKWITFTHP